MAIVFNNERVSDHPRIWLLVLFFFAAFNVTAQLAAPTLEQIKIAADAGDAAAQDKLAEQYILRTDTKQAEVWYRKSAGQGFAHAQGKLGNMLLMRYRMTFGLKPDERAALGEEALKWMTLAANQGDTQGQANLADVCLEGKLVKQDFIEAYKWGELASQGGGPLNTPGISGRSTRDSAILKMNADQIAEAKKRVAEFKPHASEKSELPQPAWVKKIKVQGISGMAGHRLVIINNQTLEKGDEATLKIDGKSVTVHCLEVHEASVSISIEGIEGTQELKLSAD